MGLRFLNHLTNVGFIRHVTGNNDCSSTCHQSLPRFEEGIFIAVEEHKPVPRRRKKFRRGPAYSGSGPGDHRNGSPH